MTKNDQNLLLDLLWLQFLYCKNEAHAAVYRGDKLEAICWAIRAHKTEQEYLYELDQLVFA
jgi:hypothetical protein